MMRLVKRSSMRRAAASLACSAALLLLATQVDAAEPAPDTQNPSKILFVGDSFTEVQGGIYSHVRMLAASAGFSSVETERVIMGGATLKRLWELGDAVHAVDSDRFDAVVIQDDIPETNIDYFQQYAEKFTAEIRDHHARPVVYMTWPYDRLNWIGLDDIIKQHKILQRRLHLEVAPVGLAWDIAKRGQRGLNLFGPDREHPNIQGMYLSACVVYATLFRKSPLGLVYHPEGVSPELARYLQAAAWKSVGAWKGR